MPMAMKARVEKLFAASGLSTGEGIRAVLGEALAAKWTPKATRGRKVNPATMSARKRNAVPPPEGADPRHVHPATPNAETAKGLRETLAGRGLTRVSTAELKEMILGGL